MTSIIDRATMSRASSCITENQGYGTCRVQDATTGHIGQTLFKRIVLFFQQKFNQATRAQSLGDIRERCAEKGSQEALEARASRVSIDSLSRLQPREEWERIKRLSWEELSDYYAPYTRAPSQCSLESYIPPFPEQEI